jgi:hypothetical protein
MEKIKEMRTEWNLQPEIVDSYVDRTVVLLRDKMGVDASAYMLVDSAYRAHLHWLHSAQLNGTEPSRVLACTVNLASSMLMEVLRRISNPNNAADIADEIFADFYKEFSEDVKLYMDRQSEKPHLHG